MSDDNSDKRGLLITRGPNESAHVTTWPDSTAPADCPHDLVKFINGDGHEVAHMTRMEWNLLQPEKPPIGALIKITDDNVQVLTKTLNTLLENWEKICILLKSYPTVIEMPGTVTTVHNSSQFFALLCSLDTKIDQFNYEKINTAISFTAPGSKELS